MYYLLCSSYAGPIFPKLATDSSSSHFTNTVAVIVAIIRDYKEFSIKKIPVVAGLKLVYCRAVCHNHKPTRWVSEISLPVRDS